MRFTKNKVKNWKHSTAMNHTKLNAQIILDVVSIYWILLEKYVYVHGCGR